MDLSPLRIITLSFVLAATTISGNALAEHQTFRNTSEAGILYELAIEAEVLETMKPLPVKIKVSGTEGSALSGAKISCVLSMPAMAMPLNTPTIKETDTAGQYEGIFLLTMGGLWQVEITSIFDTGEKETVMIPFYLNNSEEGGNSVDTKLEELFHEKKAKD